MKIEIEYTNLWTADAFVQCLRLLSPNPVFWRDSGGYKTTQIIIKKEAEGGRIRSSLICLEDQIEKGQNLRTRIDRRSPGTEAAGGCSSGWSQGASIGERLVPWHGGDRAAPCTFPKSTSAFLAPNFFNLAQQLSWRCDQRAVWRALVFLCVPDIANRVGSLLGARRHHSSINDVHTLSNQA